MVIAEIILIIGYVARCASERKKQGARLLANIAQEYGFLKPQPCQKCGCKATDKHHEDYNRPLDVTWLCRPCHVGHHVAERDGAVEEVKAFLREFLKG